MLLQVRGSGCHGGMSWLAKKEFHPETNDAYLVRRYENGSQLALVEPGGVGLAPLTVNTGPLGDLAPVVCLKDFYALKGRINHYLYDHPDDPPPRECLELMMTGIATVDGARAVGFDVGDLEEQLDTSLREIERRTS